MTGTKISTRNAKNLKHINIDDTPLATVLIPKDTIYHGRVSKGAAHDNNGLVIYADGSYYRGNIKYGIIEGKGLYKFADDTFSYEGDWVNGLPNGYGKEIGPTGTYEGSMRDSKKWGNGKMTFPNGSIYQGNFVNN